MIAFHSSRRRRSGASFFRLMLVIAVMSGLVAQAAEKVRVLSDVEFLEPGRVEKLDVYLPGSAGAGAAADGKRAPALVWIHGGGWMGGTKSESRAKEICTTLAEAGYVAVSIDYKVGAGAWPQNLHDCKNAVRFLRANADRYGVDPQRIAVAGGSAGGHLALMVAFTTGQAALEPTAPYAGFTSEVDCVINMYGITNILTRRNVTAEGVPTGERTPALRVFGAADRTAAVLRIASPVTHVKPSSPPVLILHGRADATVDYLQAEELARVLKRENVPHELVLIDGVGHTFAFQTWGKKKLDRDLRPMVFAFLEKHLK